MMIKEEEEERKGKKSLIASTENIHTHTNAQKSFQKHCRGLHLHHWTSQLSPLSLALLTLLMRCIVYTHTHTHIRRSLIEKSWSTEKVHAHTHTQYHPRFYRIYRIYREWANKCEKWERMKEIKTTKKEKERKGNKMRGLCLWCTVCVCVCANTFEPAISTSKEKSWGITTKAWLNHEGSGIIVKSKGTLLKNMCVCVC